MEINIEETINMESQMDLELTLGQMEAFMKDTS